MSNYNYQKQDENKLETFNKQNDIHFSQENSSNIKE